MGRPELQRLLDLQSFLQKFNSIDRRIFHPGSKTRLETDTEHSFSLAMAAWFLVHYFPELNKDEVIKLSLVHDLVEVYAGDTYIYGDEETLKSKKPRELAAFSRIKKEWPDFPDMVETIASYEQLASPESKFVYALDKLMPILVIFLGEGQTWHKDKITLEQLKNNKDDKVAVSPEVNKYYKKLIKLLEANQHYFG